MRKIKVRIIFAIGLALIFIGTAFSIVNLKNERPVILKVETVSDETTVKGNHFPKSTKYYDIATNGRVTRSKSTASFAKTYNQRIDVDIDNFDTYNTKNNTVVHLKIVKPIKLKDQDGKVVHDKNYWRLIKHIVKYGHYDLFNLSLFKTKKFYYVYYTLNAGPEDNDYLLRYNPKTKKFKHICEIDGRKVVKIQELK